MLPLFCLSCHGMGENDKCCSGNAQNDACQQVGNAQIRRKSNGFPVKVQEK